MPFEDKNEFVVPAAAMRDTMAELRGHHSRPALKAFLDQLSYEIKSAPSGQNLEDIKFSPEVDARLAKLAMRAFLEKPAISSPNGSLDNVLSGAHPKQFAAAKQLTGEQPIEALSACLDEATKRLPKQPTRNQDGWDNTLFVALPYVN